MITITNPSSHDMPHPRMRGREREAVGEAKCRRAQNNTQDAPSYCRRMNGKRGLEKKKKMMPPRRPASVGRRVTDTAAAAAREAGEEGCSERGERAASSSSERSVCRPGASSVAAHHPDRLGAAVMSARRVRVSNDAADVHVLDAQRRDRLLPRV